MWFNGRGELSIRFTPIIVGDCVSHPEVDTALYLQSDIKGYATAMSLNIS